MDDLAAVVLARGLGRRMQDAAPGDATLSAEQQAAADAGLKGMMPIVGPGGIKRPFLDYLLHSLADAGYREVVLVVGPDHGRIRGYYEGIGRPSRTVVRWAVQRAPLGTADAVCAAEVVVGHRPFLVVNGDNLYPVAALRAVRSIDGPGLVAFERDDLVASSHIPAERVRSFALVAVAPDGRLRDVIEKPSADVIAAAGGRALVSMNCWRFDGRIFDACRDSPRSPRGEWELTAAVRLALERGVTFQVRVAAGPVLDLSRRADIAVVAARLADVDVRP